MKILFFLLSLGIFSCKSTNTATAQEKPIEGATVAADSLPVCVKALIEKFKSEEVTNPPMSITQFMYKGKTVFYVPGPCCDNFSELYNDSCRVIGHPDGGFTGRGDGKFPNFRNEATEEKLLWKDPRSK